MVEYYSAIKNDWNVAISNNIVRPRRFYIKWSKSNRERQVLYIFTYMWNLKEIIQMNKEIKVEADL